MEAEVRMGVQRCMCHYCGSTYLKDIAELPEEYLLRWQSGGRYYPRWCGCERRKGTLDRRQGFTKGDKV